MITIAFLVATFALAESPKSDTRQTGKVVKVADGDTLTLRAGNQNYVIRLAGIDAPEDGQDFAQRSKQALMRHVSGKKVTVRVTDKDKYGRTVGIIYLDGECINTELVEEGLAWHYTRYADSKILATAEAAAKEEKRGLWADARPLPPWEWRAQRAKESAAKAAAVKEQVEVTNKAVAADRKGKSTAEKSKPSPTRKSSPTRPEPSRVAGAPPPVSSGKTAATASYWLNTSSNVRHNSSCRHFKNTKRGRSCSASEGKACGICGG